MLDSEFPFNESVSPYDYHGRIISSQAKHRLHSDSAGSGCVLPYSQLGQSISMPNAQTLNSNLYFWLSRFISSEVAGIFIFFNIPKNENQANPLQSSHVNCSSTKHGHRVHH